MFRADIYFQDVLCGEKVLTVSMTSLHSFTSLHTRYALITHPGHHADADNCGGYCYINQAAVLVESLLKKHAVSGLKKVAVLDVDYHAGNGTVSIFYDRPDVFVCTLFLCSCYLTQVPPRGCAIGPFTPHIHTHTSYVVVNSLLILSDYTTATLKAAFMPTLLLSTHTTPATQTRLGLVLVFEPRSTLLWDLGQAGTGTRRTMLPKNLTATR
jgi:hypothetical protein